MTTPLLLLHCEDSPSDAKLVALELARLQRPIVYHRVDDLASARQQLEACQWDVVLSDWSMPSFSALDVLSLVKDAGLDLPFIIVSGAVDEASAVSAMRAGAHDYVHKDRLARLVPAIEREVRDRADRRARRLAERQLLEADRRYQLIVETISQGVALVDADGRVTYASPQLGAILGRAPFSLIGRPLTEFLDAKVRVEAEAALSQRPAVRLRVDRLFVRADGSGVWVHIESTPLFDEHQVFTGRLVIFSDITERRRVEEDLRVSQQRLACLSESGIVGVTVARGSGEVLDANDAFLKMLGYTRDDLAAGALNWTKLTPPEWSGISAQILEGLGRSGSSPPREKEYLRKDGSRVPVLVGVASLGGPEMISITFDLSEAKRAERALRESESRFARLAESGIVGIGFTDVHGHLHEANDAYLKILGYDRRDFESGEINWAALTPPEWVESDQRAIKQLALHGVATPWEKELLGKDGRRVPVLIGAAMLEFPNCIAFMADLSDRKQAERALRQTEDQLRQAQKMEAVGRLAGGIAHDFNNLLSVILSCGQFVLEDLPPGDPLHEEVREICKAGRRASELTRKLLLFSRQEIFEPKVVQPSEAVAEMGRMLDRVLGEDVKLVRRAEQQKALVRIDPTGLEQVIMNLVVNARDAMPTGGTLTIETEDVVLDAEFASAHHGVSPGSYVRIAVADTGTGMDAATQAHIFEPFFTTKEKGKGTGLGLSTVFGIMHQSGGSVWVKSELGKGTTFTLYLPTVVDDADQKPASSQEAKQQGSETVLLVEDEDPVRAVARGILTRHGYQVIEARDAHEALLLCQAPLGTIHLLLSDVVMPQMSGPELARHLVEVRPEMRVLCMSGYTDDSVVRHGLRDGNFAFIQKPFTPELLARKVREVLDQAA